MNVEIHSESLPFAFLFMHHLQSHLCASLFLSGGGGWISALPLFPHHTTKGVGCCGESSPPTRLLLVPARRGYRLFMNILFTNMINVSNISFISGFRREVDAICALQRYYAAYGGNSLNDVSGRPIWSHFRGSMSPEASVRNHHYAA
jgi:hypothetical protein